MEKIFVDTSAWVALYLENDEHHKKAVEIFQKLKNSRVSIYTSDYVADETITHILFRSSHQQSIAVGEILFSSEVIKIIYVYPNYFLPAWELYKKYDDKRFSFTDVTSFTIAKELGIKRAFSFDSDFPKAGIELLTNA